MMNTNNDENNQVKTLNEEEMTQLKSKIDF